MTQLKTYLVRWKPLQYTPGNDTREIIVKAYNEKEAYKQIPEKYSSHIAFEVTED